MKFSTALMIIGIIALCAVSFLIGADLFVSGAACGWPEWTKVGMTARVWGRC